ncbi:hypothetical protein GCM10009838_55900 [Catenulispora subtropica]|uniref:Uncharacterized protein n=1 Tax=Catenulispora subtropica TaxID=450798 RepID=A0ABN2SGN0_9ACTN
MGQGAAGMGAGPDDDEPLTGEGDVLRHGWATPFEKAFGRPFGRTPTLPQPLRISPSHSFYN